jgi:type IV secretory pathway TrbD component
MPFTAYLGEAAGEEIQRRVLTHDNLMAAAAENLVAEAGKSLTGAAAGARRWFYATLALVIGGVPVSVTLTEILIHHLRWA